MCRSFYFFGVLGAVTGLRLNRKTGEDQFYVQQLENHQNTQYVGEFEIGGQKMKAIYDTGSFEILVLSTRCDQCVVKAYDRHKSDHYHKNGTLVRHVFGSGPTVSMQGSDDVQVGSMVAKDQIIWEIVEHNIRVLDHAAFQAIVGIGPGKAPTNNQDTLVMSLGIDVFSVCLEKPAHSPGWLIWGEPPSGDDYHLDRGEFLEVPVVGKLHWGANMTSLRGMEDGSEGDPVFCKGMGCAAIIDSGTSLLAVPSDMLEALSPVVGHIQEDCSNLDELPTLRFNLGDEVFSLPPRAYIMKINKTVSTSGYALHGQVANVSYGINPKIFELLYFKPKHLTLTDDTGFEKKVICTPAFMMINKMTQLGPLVILGMPFLRYYYTTFDRTDRVMRFAHAGPQCHPESAKAGPTSHLHVSSKVTPTDMDHLEPLEVQEDELMVPTWAMDDSPTFEL